MLLLVQIITAYAAERFLPPPLTFSGNISRFILSRALTIPALYVPFGINRAEVKLSAIALKIADIVVNWPVLSAAHPPVLSE
jgi:hypothetical protein